MNKMLQVTSEISETLDSKKSIIKFTPKRDDNGKQISCKAENPRMRAHSKEDNIFLSISCKYNFIFLCIDRFQTLNASELFLTIFHFALRIFRSARLDSQMGKWTSS